MARSLSAILPVHNAEATLHRQLAGCLEVLEDLSAPFELLIVDDGSSDRTEEIATEYTRRYPQVRFTRHPFKKGAAEAVRTGLERTRGEVVFVFCDERHVGREELQRIGRLERTAELARFGSDPRSRRTAPR